MERNYSRLVLSSAYNWKYMFNVWLLSQLQERNWSQADLARASNLTTAAISRYMTDRIPDKVALRKLSRALKLPPETLFEKAGLLPKKPPKDELTEKIVYALAQLPEQEREEIYQYIQLRQEINEKKGRYATGTA